jgi:predicted dithiol-disulfide oxidoreductase (DUF899 family)
MSAPQITSWDEWIEARRALLAREKEFTRQRDELNAERRRLPMVEIDKQYAFDGPDGKVSLLDLFEGRRQLIVYHFMFGPDWDEGCPGCSFLVDNIGHLSHLHARNTTLAVVSRAPLEKLLAYQQRMGWTVPWYSSYGSDFNYDFHVTHDPAVAPLRYNYQAMTDIAEDAEWPSESPGTSVFLRDGDRIFYTYGSYARGADLLLGTYNWLDLTALGRQEDWEQPPGRSDGPFFQWLRRHDQYEAVEASSR